MEAVIPEGLLIDISESAEDGKTPSVNDGIYKRVQEEVEANLKKIRIAALSQTPNRATPVDRGPVTPVVRSDLRRMDSCANMGLDDEVFNFDCNLSPDHKNTVVDGEVFFRPVGFTEQITSARVKENAEPTVDDIDSYSAADMAHVFKEATSVVIRIKAAAERETAPPRPKRFDPFERNLIRSSIRKKPVLIETEDLLVSVDDKENRPLDGNVCASVNKNQSNEKIVLGTINEKSSVGVSNTNNSPILIDLDTINESGASNTSKINQSSANNISSINQSSATNISAINESSATNISKINQSSATNISVSTDISNHNTSINNSSMLVDAEVKTKQPVKRSGTFKIPKSGHMSFLSKDKLSTDKPPTEKVAADQAKSTDVKKPPLQKRLSLQVKPRSDISNLSAVKENNNAKVQRNKFGGSLRGSRNPPLLKAKLMQQSASMSKDDNFIDLSSPVPTLKSSPAIKPVQPTKPTPPTKPTSPKKTTPKETETKSVVSSIKPMIKKALGHLQIGGKSGNMSLNKSVSSSTKHGLPQKKVCLVKPMKAESLKSEPMKAVQPVKQPETSSRNAVKATANFSLNDSEVKSGRCTSTPLSRSKGLSLAPPKALNSSITRRTSSNTTPRRPSASSVNDSITLGSPINPRNVVASSTPSSSVGGAIKRPSFLPTPTRGSRTSTASQRISSVSSVASDDVFDKSVDNSNNSKPKIARLISFDSCDTPKTKSKILRPTKK